MMAKYPGPGPGQVSKYANDVKLWDDEDPRHKGVRAAMAWVMADPTIDTDFDDKDPITGKSTDGPPDMNTIHNATKKAGGESGSGSKKSTRSDPEFRAGVRACLEWIIGKGDRPEQQSG
jgi:hypothetical protein